MLSIATAWLHETSVKPLQLFDHPQHGKCTLMWEPVEGKKYVISFSELSAIAQERTHTPHPMLVSFHEAGDNRVYSSYMPHIKTVTESDLAKDFRMKKGHRLTALMALLCFALPEYNKYHGKEAYETLIRDTKTKD